MTRQIAELSLGLSRLRGIVPVVQTPFDSAGGLAESDLGKLLDDAVAAGASGFLIPAVASEVQSLSASERSAIVHAAVDAIAGRAGLVVGASAQTPEEVNRHLQLAGAVGADAALIAAPTGPHASDDWLIGYFRAAIGDCTVPIVVQDLDWQGNGLPLAAIERLRAEIPTIAGIKIETVPAGPKYTAVRQCCGADFHISGGWAVPQMIEALDRGVDAMIPECSMVRVYVAIVRLHRSGDRAAAIRWFRRLQPILAFANQEIGTSIAFFKRLLVRRGIFGSAAMRMPGFAWDDFNRRIADELIDEYLELEAAVRGADEGASHSCDDAGARIAKAD